MKLRRLVLSLLLLGFAAACGGGDDGAKSGEKVLHLPMRTAGPGSLDPVLGSTVYDNRATQLFYETLLQYKYLARPSALEPLLVTEMPAESERDGKKVYTFKLKQGVMFQDDACFPDGKGREMVASDVEYSWKRLADPKYERKNWWLVKDTIVGFDAFMEVAKEAGTCDYSRPVEGLKVVDDYTFEVTLVEPNYSFLWKVAMFQFSIVPREAVEHYEAKFSTNPVGTGPFILAPNGWQKEKSLTALKSPSFRDEFYPSEWMPEDEELGLHLAKGAKLPLADRVEITMFVNENPMWLEFNSGGLDYTQVPAENYDAAFNDRSRKLKKAYRDKGVVDHQVPLLDFIFRQFNMEDELVGGYTPEKQKLRRAIALATDLEEFNKSFYNDTNVIYDGMIPPGLDGHPEGGRAEVSNRGPNLELARQLLAEAGYPEGQGLPAIDYYINSSGNTPEQAELWKRQLAKIGVELNVRALTIAKLIQEVNSKKAPIFGFAWSSDYPDGENNLALFYGPNESPGSNHANYKRAEYDEMYERVRTMAPSAERTALYESMRNMVTEDVAFIGSMARTRFYLVNPHLKNFKPSEDFYNWVKYLDVE